MKKINSSLFKLAMSKFATGVTVITINSNGKLIGKTVNSFAALSLNPPLILFSLDKKSSSLNLYKKAIYIGINILAKNQKKISDFFSTKKPIWGEVPFIFSEKKVPLIKNSIVNIQSKKIRNIQQGDHIIFICEINKISIDNKKKSLIYLNSQYY